MSERQQAGGPQRPWWREPMMWMVVGGPAVVVVAASVTAFIAWNGRDPEVLRAEGVRQSVQAKDPLAPALRARNHANTPAEPGR